MSFSILGAGVATPPHAMNQDEALALAEGVLRPDEDRARMLHAVYRRSGVEQRQTSLPHEAAREWAERYAPTGLGAPTRHRMELYEELAPPLALDAARRALESSGVSADGVSHLVTVSCTGFAAPGVDAALINGLGLPATTERVNVGFMGCHGAINGLRTARGLALSSPANRVLLCAVELCSLHYFFGDVPDKLVSNALFADGAAALVGGTTERDDRRDGTWRVLATGSCLLPDSRRAMSWRVGDHGFEMTLDPTVPERVAEALPGWIEPWLAEQGVAIDDIRHWILHPGGPKILSAVVESLGLPESAADASRRVLARHGNMSSPTVLFIADELSRQQAAGLGVMLAFGPGLAAEAALVDFAGG